MNKAIITSASGQDSIELSKNLLNRGYKVYAIARRNARSLPIAVDALLKNKNYTILNGDITDMPSIINAIKLVKPDCFFNLAAQSHVGLSFAEPISTAEITGLGVLNCLEAIRKTDTNIRFYQASSSEQFGGTKSVNGFINTTDLKNKIEYAIINEQTPFEPKSPYGCAKVFGHNITKNYREAYNLHASCGILFNHEGIYRKREFVTRKVTSYVAQLIYFGTMSEKLALGTLDFARDWGAATDYVDAMRLIVEQQAPDDFVIATGKLFTGKDLVETAFKYGAHNWEEYVEINPTRTGVQGARPSDVKVLCGDASKAKRFLDWEATTSFKDMIYGMIDNDLKLLNQYNGVIID